MYRKILIAFLAIVLLSIITNPSPSQYYYYCKGKYGNGRSYRKANFLVFSIYTYNDGAANHVALLGNFIALKEPSKHNIGIRPF